MAPARSGAGRGGGIGFSARRRLLAAPRPRPPRPPPSRWLGRGPDCRGAAPGWTPGAPIGRAAAPARCPASQAAPRGPDARAARPPRRGAGCPRDLRGQPGQGSGAPGAIAAARCDASGLTLPGRGPARGAAAAIGAIGAAGRSSMHRGRPAARGGGGGLTEGRGQDQAREEDLPGGHLCLGGDGPGWRVGDREICWFELTASWLLPGGLETRLLCYWNTKTMAKRSNGGT
jgi:hypothetical protein